jgi:hypothetical protein
MTPAEATWDDAKFIQATFPQISSLFFLTKWQAALHFIDQ